MRLWQDKVAEEKNEKSFVFLFRFIKVCWGEQEPHFFSSGKRAFQRLLNSSVEVSSSITMSPLWLGDSLAFKLGL